MPRHICHWLSTHTASCLTQVAFTPLPCRFLPGAVSEVGIWCTPTPHPVAPNELTPTLVTPHTDKSPHPTTACLALNYSALKHASDHSFHLIVITRPFITNTSLHNNTGCTFCFHSIWHFAVVNYTIFCWISTYRGALGSAYIARAQLSSWPRWYWFTFTLFRYSRFGCRVTDTASIATILYYISMASQNYAVASYRLGFNNITQLRS